MAKKIKPIEKSEKIEQVEQIEKPVEVQEVKKVEAPKKVETAKEQRVRVKCSLNLRMAPHANASIVRVMKAGEELAVLAEVNEWLKVDGGFCMKKYTEKI